LADRERERANKRLKNLRRIVRKALSEYHRLQLERQARGCQVGAVSDWRRIVWLPGTFAVCRLPAHATIAIPPSRGTLFSLTRTDSETSMVCEERDAPPDARCEMGWSAFRLDGPIPFETTGVLASLSS